MKANQLNTTLRVAGGWVRDKLMNKDSKDIDIALDNMTGSEFVQIFNNYLKEKNVLTKGYGVVKLNPEKSKHLETATLCID